MASETYANRAIREWCTSHRMDRRRAGPCRVERPRRHPLENVNGQVLRGLGRNGLPCCCAADRRSAESRQTARNCASHQLGTALSGLAEITRAGYLARVGVDNADCGREVQAPLGRAPE